MSKPVHALLVEARFYEDISDELSAGAVAALEAAGATYERVSVPGALEIPGAISIAAKAKGDDGQPRFDCYLALGCVIRGETTHYDYVCGESARGLMDLNIQRDLAIGNGILTVENRDQAMARAGQGENQKNKGRDVAEAALALVALKETYGLR